MSFASLEYIFVFLPVTWAIYYLLNWILGPISGRIALIGASLVFCGYGHLWALKILAASATLNYLAGLALQRFPRRVLLFAAVAANVGLLVYFKYSNFLLENWGWAMGRSLKPLALVFPIGISFYTLRQIGYLVGCYQRDIRDRSIFNYLLFVSFFPAFIMGPITVYGHLVPQLDRPQRIRPEWNQLGRGAFLFALGFGKKMGVADALIPMVDALYRDTAGASVAQAWIGSFAFMFQLYFDFSGYMDMAIGSALMLGITLPPNFDLPFRSRNIVEFWSRWHITLTRFLTTYVYTPMLYAFRRLTFWKSMGVTLVTTLISGAWHGAGWTFLAFGLAHGLALVTNHFGKKRHWRLPAGLAWLATFLFLNLTFVLFRADRLGTAGRVFRAMVLGGGTLDGRVARQAGVLVLLTALVAIPWPRPDLSRLRSIWTEHGGPDERFVLVPLALVGLAFIAAFLLTRGQAGEPYVYQFF